MKSEDWQQIESDASVRDSKGIYFPGDLYFYGPEQKYYVVLAIDLMYHPVRLMGMEESGGKHLAKRDDIVMLYQCVRKTNKLLSAANLPILSGFGRYVFAKDRYPYSVLNMSDGKFESNTIQNDLNYQVYELKDGKLVK